MKEKETNLEKERELMRVAHQLVETKYESRQDFIEQAKLEVKRNFESFVKNEKPDDPNEYKANMLNSICEKPPCINMCVIGCQILKFGFSK